MQDAPVQEPQDQVHDRRSLTEVQCPFTRQPISVYLRPYTAPVPPFTHWYEHPQYQVPIPVTLSTEAGGSDCVFGSDGREALSAAQQSGSVLVVMSWMEGGERKYFRRTSGYPRGEMMPLAQQIREDFCTESGVADADRVMPTVRPELRHRPHVVDSPLRVTKETDEQPQD